MRQEHKFLNNRELKLKKKLRFQWRILEKRSRRKSHRRIAQRREVQRSTELSAKVSESAEPAGVPRSTPNFVVNAIAHRETRRISSQIRQRWTAELRSPKKNAKSHSQKYSFQNIKRDGWIGDAIPSSDCSWRLQISLFCFFLSISNMIRSLHFSE